MAPGVLAGTTALVTGASSGLGVDFARGLARRGSDLILVARRQELLETHRTALHADFGVDVQVIAQDLTAPDGVERLHDATRTLGKPVDILVNNAGFGAWGRFVDIPWEQQRQLLALDIVALVHLTKLYVNGMVERGHGYILQVGSIGAFQPTPTYATYSAAKSFVLSFGEALNHELKGTGVSCTVVSPGVTRTEFLDTAGQKPTRYQRAMMMESPEVARQAIEAMLARRSGIVPGFLNALVAWSTRLAPRRLTTAMAERMMTWH